MVAVPVPCVAQLRGLLQSASFREAQVLSGALGNQVLEFMHSEHESVDGVGARVRHVPRLAQAILELHDLAGVRDVDVKMSGMQSQPWREYCAMLGGGRTGVVYGDHGPTVAELLDAADPGGIVPGYDPQEIPSPVFAIPLLREAWYSWTALHRQLALPALRRVAVARACAIAARRLHEIVDEHGELTGTLDGRHRFVSDRGTAQAELDELHFNGLGEWPTFLGVHPSWVPMAGYHHAAVSAHQHRVYLGPDGVWLDARGR